MGVDLGKTAAEWDVFGGTEFATTLLGPVRFLREVEDRFRREREQVIVRNDFSSFLDVPGGGMTITGVIPGTNSTKRGQLYARLTGSGGSRTVSINSATGGASIVASGTAADGATVTLAEQNDSGISGTWKLPGSAANTVADELVCEVHVDWRRLLTKVYTQDRGISDDADSKAVIDAGCLAVANAMRSALRSWLVTVMPRALLNNGQDNPIARGNEFLVSAETALLSDVAGGDGENVTRILTGLIQRMSDAMNGEATGGEQFVLERNPAAAAGAFDSANDGLGTVASHTPGQACPPTRWRFKCSDGADDGSLGSELFDVEISFTKDGDERRLNESGLQINRTWKGPLGFGAITLLRTLSKTGDGGNADFDAASAASVTGETNANTDGGDLHVLITSNTSNWDIAFYSSSAFLSGDKVAEALNVATAAAFTATQTNSSGLQVAWTVGSAPTTTNTAVLKLNPFNRSNSANSKPDEFTVVVTTSGDQGLIQEVLSEEFGGSLNETTSGGETIEDDYIKACTFADYAVQDN